MGIRRKKKPVRENPKKLDTKKSMFTLKNGLSLLLAIIISLAALYSSAFFDEFSQFGYAGVFLISLISSATVFLPMPGFVVVFAMGRVLDPILVGLFAGLGAGIGELSGYFAGFAGHGAVMNTKIFKEHKKRIHDQGMLVMFVLALIPNPAFDIAGVAAGALKMPIWKFLAVVCAGKALRFIMLAMLGDASAGLF